jgi:hypothetical protein
MWVITPTFVGRRGRKPRISIPRRVGHCAEIRARDLLNTMGCHPLHRDPRCHKTEFCLGHFTPCVWQTGIFIRIISACHLCCRPAVFTLVSCGLSTSNLYPRKKPQIPPASFPTLRLFWISGSHSGVYEELLKVIRRFGWTHLFHLQDKSVKQNFSAFCPLHTGVLLGLLFDGRRRRCGPQRS